MRGMNQTSSRLTAILGPTNTGKTYLAIEKMLQYASGMMGFPLRLLARENYDRLCDKLGAQHVALITGEERHVPPSPKYWICTVEAMPVDREVDYVAVDEIQLAADYERGYHFTEKLLNVRGKVETVFIGAETIKPILQKLFPDIEIITRERFSKLSYSGYKKLTRLPKRSAIIAFSSEDVYRIAELVRQRLGGAAVVLGALSPRTRNAQVAMYQAGEVDFLVATDAIGMGLNMNIDHIAFARTSKFDGRMVRHLTAAEMAQIAGRAGRHTADGTFGCTEVVENLPDELVQAVENHTFPPLSYLMWRNSALDFSSPWKLLHSLEMKPPKEMFFRPQTSEDREALLALLQDNEIADRAAQSDALRMLWDVCLIPDFEKILSETYVRFLKQAFLHLCDGDGVLPDEWVDEQVQRIDRIDGDIDALTTRLGRIRTWTYIANRGQWLADSSGWRKRTRQIEDRLSDALHDKLTERFVEKRAGLNPKARMFCHVLADHSVMIDNQRVGWLNGFSFNPDHQAKNFFEVREVMRTIRPALQHESLVRAARIARDDSATITLNTKGELVWEKAIVGRICKGSALLKPFVELSAGDWLLGDARQMVERRLHAWVIEWLQRVISPLLILSQKTLSPAGRGVAFQLVESLGCMQREDVKDLVHDLTKDDRIALGAMGVHMGSVLVWIDRLWTPEAMRARALLWSAWNGQPTPPPPQGKSIPSSPLPKGAWHAMGYSVFAGRAVRADIVEEFIPLLHQNPVPPAHNLAKNIGLSENNLPSVLRALGYSILKRHDQVRYIKRSEDKIAVEKTKNTEKPSLDPVKAADFLNTLWGRK